MKKIGILGGIGWPSTVEYYTRLCELAEQRHAETRRQGPTGIPEMVIESLDLARATALLGSDDHEASWLAFDDYHRTALQRLARSGAAFAVIACNTAHHRLESIERDLDIPVLGILDVAVDACARLGVDRVLVLGTMTVMTSAVFRNAFLERGIDARGPREHRHKSSILAAIEALARGRDEGASDCIRRVVAETMGAGHESGTTAVYLGCTELPLAFQANKTDGVFECDAVRYINSTALHIRAAFECALEDPRSHQR